jgi:hypothetical protein
VVLTRCIDCAGDDFKESVDLAYLKGMTVNDPVPEARFARHCGRLGWDYGRLQLRQDDVLEEIRNPAVFGL